MNLVTLVGLRGGAGTSTVVGMLGDALHARGDLVAIFDCDHIPVRSFCSSVWGCS
ncbi:hypothetical protein CDEF62S_02873 [Castellaniella defragrans]